MSVLLCVSFLSPLLHRCSVMVMHGGFSGAVYHEKLLVISIVNELFTKAFLVLFITCILSRTYLKMMQNVYFSVIC